MSVQSTIQSSSSPRIQFFGLGNFLHKSETTPTTSLSNRQINVSYILKIFANLGNCASQLK